MPLCTVCKALAKQIYLITYDGADYHVYRCDSCGHMFRTATVNDRKERFGAIDTVSDADLYNNGLLRRLLSWVARCDAAMLKRQSNKDRPRL